MAIQQQCPNIFMTVTPSTPRDSLSYGGPQVSRQEQEAHGKSKKLTARAESSRQEHHRRGLGTTSLIAKHHGTFSKWLPPHVLAFGLCRLCLRFKKKLKNVLFKLRYIYFGKRNPLLF
jgi:hypothetical protein